MQYIQPDAAAGLSPCRAAICDAYREVEATVIEKLLAAAAIEPAMQGQIDSNALTLIETMRQRESQKTGVESLMQEYDLSSQEGIALMCLAESLLRIPDKATKEKLIEDKLANLDWASHIDKDKNWFLNAATWGLMVTGKVYNPTAETAGGLSKALRGLVKRSGDPIIRSALMQALKVMAKQFVMGETIEAATKRAAAQEAKGYTYSYDMLGEAARTQADAQRYFEAYLHAIATIATSQEKGTTKRPGISIKLSALHPRYESNQIERVKSEMLPKLHALVEAAKAADIGLTVDAEEADKLDMSLDLIEAIALDERYQGWHGFGLAVQAYQKRALPVLAWLNDLSVRANRRFMVRLVKGAYWDSEIKLSQELGLSGFPVFTRKQSTDVSYIACAKYLIANPKAFYPQFASHNAQTVSTIQMLAGANIDYEFQRLHGMGETLYDQLIEAKKAKVRVYAPVGGHQYLLAYLVRRLLENGANTSFVNQIHDNQAPIAALIANPYDKLKQKQQKAHPGIVLPVDLFGASRKNSRGIDFSNPAVLLELQAKMGALQLFPMHVAPTVSEHAKQRRETVKIINPANHQALLGEVEFASELDVQAALTQAQAAFLSWSKVPVDTRAQCLFALADLLEEKHSELLALLIKEAGKTFENAISEIREAADFCRYYADRAKSLFAIQALPGPTGELNQLHHEARGVVVCISPWNFPLAIFLGQVVAALVTGNTVIAKPAEQTPLVADYVVSLCHQVGIPQSALISLPGRGEVIGAHLVEDARTAAVMFTGSTQTAKHIQRSLASRAGAIVPLIAETGGQNCMIVDSSALLEQCIPDVIQSAFDSAGQRCSALRVVYVQEEICDAFKEMLAGAMAELVVSDPAYLATDVGPVIDQEALEVLEAHCQTLDKRGQCIYRVNCQLPQGTFLPPAAYQIDDINMLSQEFFGPILHVISYKSSQIEQVYDAINGSGFGLTFGMHSRIVQQSKNAEAAIRAGNVYINRNMVGAVVGVQPFGGCGLSGTGPKAGGPNYLHSLVIEKTISVNTTAFGGNASLLSLDDDWDEVSKDSSKEA